jgi:hypothetical protein
MQTDKDQLTAWAGEQFLLQNERSAVAAQNKRDALALQGAVNSLFDSASQSWRDNAQALVERCHAGKRQLIELDARIAQLKELTGL